MIAGYTDKGFKLIDFNSDNWHTDEHDNWTLIDALLEASLGDVPFPVVGGTANDITLNYTPDIVLQAGTTIVFILTGTPTGITTITVDGNPPKDLHVLGVSVVAGDLQTGDTVKAIYDGAFFNVISPLRKFSKLSIIDGASGAVAAAFFDNVVISSNVEAGLSILTPNNKIAGVVFGNPTGGIQGGLLYQQSAAQLSLLRDGVHTVEFRSTGPLFLEGVISLNLTGANDLFIGESAPDIVRIGSNGAINGLSIDITSGLVSTLGDFGVAGNLTVVGTLTATVNLATVTGTLALANGGSGATTAAGARTAYGLGALAVLGSINDSNWVGADLAIANGGTGASTAATALANLGGLDLAGGTITGNITRSTKGIHPYFNDAAMTSGKIFVQAIGADPTGSPGDIVFEY